MCQNKPSISLIPNMFFFSLIATKWELQREIWGVWTLKRPEKED